VLAGWLTEFVLGGAEMLPEFAADAYRDALGEQGWSEYRRAIVRAWRRDPSGWREKDLMRELVRADGDVDELIAVYAADLAPTGYTHLEIAHELDHARRADEALEWAERGLREATEHVHHELVDYVVARYGDDGAHEKALTVRQDQFRAHRTLANYRALRDAARQAGRWDEIRAWALGELRVDATDARRRSGFGLAWGDGPVWISALIDDGDTAAAWRSALGVASDHQWLILADLIREDRPADALGVYLRAVESLKARTGDPTYQQVADLLDKIRTCHQRLGTSPQFDVYLAALRADQKRKRNLIKLLDQRGLNA
jgi:uncharacterized Zn finger protein